MSRKNSSSLPSREEEALMKIVRGGTARWEAAWEQNSDIPRIVPNAPKKSIKYEKPSKPAINPTIITNKSSAKLQIYEDPKPRSMIISAQPKQPEVPMVNPTASTLYQPAAISREPSLSGLPKSAPSITHTNTNISTLSPYSRSKLMPVRKSAMKSNLKPSSPLSIPEGQGQGNKNPLHSEQDHNDNHGDIKGHTRAVAFAENMHVRYLEYAPQRRRKPQESPCLVPNDKVASCGGNSSSASFSDEFTFTGRNATSSPARCTARLDELLEDLRHTMDSLSGDLSMDLDDELEFSEDDEDEREDAAKAQAGLADDLDYIQVQASRTRAQAFLDSLKTSA